MKELLLNFATHVRRGDRGLTLLKSKPKDVVYLRVVTRVYLTGRVHISLFNDEAVGLAAKAGAATRPVAVLDLAHIGSDAKVKDRYAELNEVLATEFRSIPGGSVKVAAASSRSVSLVETFPRPLVIGYLAYDLAILKKDRKHDPKDELILGAPQPTQNRIRGQEFAPDNMQRLDKYEGTVRKETTSSRPRTEGTSAPAHASQP